jgi:NAD(P)-dependent dehydrogenase (short-subunit alcohol dehydrogenase family)
MLCSDQTEISAIILSAAPNMVGMAAARNRPMIDQTAGSSITEKEKLRGRIAVVTGAGNGIGRAEAKAIAGLGALVVVQDVRQDFADETAQEIVDASGLAETLVCDVSYLDTMISALEGLERDDRGVDILVNNVGMGGVQALEEVSRDHFDQMIG